jgi:hypothetical protein
MLGDIQIKLLAFVPAGNVRQIAMRPHAGRDRW